MSQNAYTFLKKIFEWGAPQRGTPDVHVNLVVPALEMGVLYICIMLCRVYMYMFPEGMLLYFHEAEGRGKI